MQSSSTATMYYMGVTIPKVWPHLPSTKTRSALDAPAKYVPHRIHMLNMYRAGRCRYITVDDVSRRRLWYWLAASENDPKRDPVVLWLTGGPGCSSLDAFVYENGPFKLQFATGQCWSLICRAVVLQLITPGWMLQAHRQQLGPWHSAGSDQRYTNSVVFWPPTLMPISNTILQSHYSQIYTPESLHGRYSRLPASN
jgi:hypothetical protein